MRGSELQSQHSRLSLIVAMAKNRVIGADNKIPWHLPNELKLFKSLTMGHHIIMGRKTYESIGRLLPGRTTVIVTRQREYAVAGAVVAHSIDEALAACRGDAEVFVIGGADLFRVTLPVADRLYLTTVDAEPAGDTFMPALDTSAWKETSSQPFEADDKHAYAYRLVIYDRARGGDGRPAARSGERE
ncbi:MAG: Dihydrofolate reductase [Betaproteobacteria bacterium]|nr:Dihydrofolate reductase [Betaproteobacteria bacterium]